MKPEILRHWAGYGLRRAGLPGWIGLLALAVAGGYALGTLLPMAEQLGGLERRIDGLAGQLREGSVQAPAATTGQQLASFYRDFPAEQGIPDVLARLHDLAAAEELALEVGEYALAPAPEGQLDRYRITLPVKGGYRQVRQFVAQALAAVPALSLESLSLRREQVAEAAAEARIVFVLFLEHGA
jgi:Tfp pilus assembly protein PilO